MEDIFLKKALTLGWVIININNITYRTICFSNRKNSLGIIKKDHSINDCIINIMNKYNIINYHIENLDNEHVFSYTLLLEEESYTNLINNIKESQLMN